VHKLFARQLAKATTPSGGIDLDELGGLVGSAYDQADHDRRRTDRSISLMIEELDTLNRGLENLVAVRTEALRDSETQLKAQNLRFEAAVNNMSQALLMFDRDRRLVICNLPADVRPLPRGSAARLHAAWSARTTQSGGNLPRRHRPISD
jgi:PAS domain-containing protein